MIEDDNKTRSLHQETSEISSLFENIPATTNVLVVDTNFTTLLNMKKLMEKYAYQVTIKPDAESALTFLTSCEHKINIVIWDFHMPKINGIQALEAIGSKMDLPVVIMSDDDQTESVMKAIMHGACAYVMKPVKESVIATIWQHIVRRMMKKMMPKSKPDLIPPVKSSDLAQPDGLEQDKVDPVTVVVDEAQNIDKREDNASKSSTQITRTGEIQPVHQSEFVQNDYFETVLQNNNGEFQADKAAKKPRMTWSEVFQWSPPDDLVQNNGVGGQKNNDGNLIMQKHYGKRIMEKEVDLEKKEQKTRMTWTNELHKKFVEAIDIVGGIEKATPKALLECLEEMNVEGLTRANVSSHLQKYRIHLEEIELSQQMHQISWSAAYRPSPSFQDSDNVHTAMSSYLRNGRAVNSIQFGQYRNGHSIMNNNQFITNPMSRLSYLDHHLHQHQPYQSPHQCNPLMSNKEPEQASEIFATDLGRTNPSALYDPK